MNFWLLLAATEFLEVLRSGLPEGSQNAEVMSLTEVDISFF